MSANTVENYGWHLAEDSYSTSYIAPRIKQLLAALKIRRVVDLGAGNGGLCGQLAAEGYEVVGIEYDRNGVEIAMRTHPEVRFYNFGVQDDPDQLLPQEAPFEAVVSTEVIEHLFAPHLLPLYARQILQTGGHLIITTPYHGYLKNLALSVFNDWDKHHTVLWQNGFTVTSFNLEMLST